MSFYIKTDTGSYFYMDAVVSVAYSQTGKVSSYVLEDGTSSSDHYDQDPDGLTFSGYISSVKFVSNNVNTTDFATFQLGLTSIKKTGVPFTCYFSDTFEEMDNCLFTSLVFSQDVDTGMFCAKVDFNIQQIEYAAQAAVVSTPTALDQFKDTTTVKSKGSSATKDLEAEDVGRIREISNELKGTLNGTTN